MGNEHLHTSLIEALGSFYRTFGNRTLQFQWKDGIEFKAIIETLSETDNGLNLNDENYIEYHACFIIVTKIIECRLEKELIIKRFGHSLKKNLGYEVSYLNAPDRICSEGMTIWKKI